MNKHVKTIIIAVICSTIISGAMGTFIYSKLSQKATKEELITEFYEVENAVYISPHSLRKSMDKGENKYLVVDLRSKQEYEKEHILGAINIPAYSDPDTSAYGEIDRIAGEFKKLPKDKEVVVYCYSIPCMTGRKVGQMLSTKGIYVKHLGIGWNEWRYYWNLWNHEHEWDKTKVEDYIEKGKEPGILKKILPDSITPCSLDKNFGC